MMLKCDHCGELTVDEDEQVCNSCGIVVEDIQLTHEITHQRFSSYFVPNKYGNRISKKSKPPIALAYGLSSLKNLCHVFSISSERELEAVNMLKDVYASKRHRYKEDVGVIAGCCLFLLQRKYKQSISIRDMCLNLGCSKKKFYNFLKYSKAWLSVKEENLSGISEEDGFFSYCQGTQQRPDPDLPEMAESFIPAICDKASEEEKSKLMKKTAELVKLAYKCWLFTGRSPRSVVVSCAFLSWKSMNAKRKKASFTQFCSEFSIKEPMAKLRIPELKDFLLKLGLKIPSRAENYVNEDNLLFHLDTILENSETLRNDLLTDVYTEEDINCKEYAAFRTINYELPRAELKSAVKYEPNMIASDVEISDTEIESYIKTEKEKKIINDLQNSKIKGCSF